MTKITQILNDGDVVNEGHFQQIKDVVNTNDDIATPLQVAYSTTVKADRTRFITGRHSMTGPVAITLDVGSVQTQDAAIPGLGQTLWFLGDGNNITISGGTIVPSQNATIATEAGVELLLVFVWSGSYWQIGVEGANNIAPPTIIVMQDDFAGTTIDTAKWTVLDPVDELDVSQNNQLNIDANASPAAFLTHSLNNVSSKFGSPGGTGIQSIQGDIYSDNYGLLTPYLKIWDGTNDNKIEIGHSTLLDGNARLTVKLNSATVYDFDTSISLANTFKIEVNLTTIKFYYLSAGAWLQLGSTRTIDFTGKTLTPLLTCSLTTASVGTEQSNFKNYYQTNANYLTAIPV